MKPGTPRHLRINRHVVVQRTGPRPIGPITWLEYVGMAILGGIVIGAMTRLALRLLGFS